MSSSCLKKTIGPLLTISKRRGSGSASRSVASMPFTSAEYVCTEYEKI